jgi:2-polyprenyl-3-methyl-5-hydroxy-6-metoxy-1,4-benzoquinol methylase
LGCAAADEFVLTGHDRLYGLPGEFSVVRCRVCGLLRTDPRPTQSGISCYYPENYEPHQVGSPGKGLHRSRLRERASQLLGVGGQRLPPLPPGRMLEIGCANGAFLEVMRVQGWQVEGVEPCERPAAAARARGFAVDSQPIEELSRPDSSFDLVVGWMVLEHLHHPVTVLQKLRSWTRPGGWLVISTPDLSGLDFRLFGTCSYSLDLPRHLHHFTSRTLHRILRKGGWTVQKRFYHRTLNSLLASAGCALQERRRIPPLAHWLVHGRSRAWLYPAAWVLALAGQTGRITVWARRE